MDTIAHAWIRTRTGKGCSTAYSGFHSNTSPSSTLLSPKESAPGQHVCRRSSRHEYVSWQGLPCPTQSSTTLSRTVVRPILPTSTKYKGLISGEEIWFAILQQEKRAGSHTISGPLYRLGSSCPPTTSSCCHYHAASPFDNPDPAISPAEERRRCIASGSSGRTPSRVN